MRLLNSALALLAIAARALGDGDPDEGVQIPLSEGELDQAGVEMEMEENSIPESSRTASAYKFYDPLASKYPNTEYMELKPLKGNNLLASFKFEANATTDLYPNEDDIQHYNIFSKALGTVLKDTNTRELHLRFGHGWYDAELNGKLVSDGKVSGGTGVELWATIESPEKAAAQNEWRKLVNSLSGMFCASLNFIDDSVTTYPIHVFNHDANNLKNVELRGNLFNFRSALPREPICTENLTPFLILLPTKGRAGISTLLAGNKMFNAEWSSMAIDVVTECAGENDCKYVMKQEINLILNVPKVLERNVMPVPRPTPGEELRCDESKINDAYNCFPLPPTSEYDYDLKDLFGTLIKGGSMITSDVSRFCLDVNEDEWGIEIMSLAPVTAFNDAGKYCFNLDSTADYNVKLSAHDANKINTLEQPPIFASRSLSGFSQDAGGFRLDVHNPGEKDLDIIIFQTLPWFVRFYLHSLELTLTSEDGTQNTFNVDDQRLSAYIKEIVYNPAMDRKAPTHLELSVVVPKQTKMKFSFSFDKAMLLYAEYPPDANHGFELEPAVFAIKSGDAITYVMRTTTNLLTLPTPDFSMPYNVIILTSTVMSVTFGSIFNMLTKRTVTEEEAEEFNAQQPLPRIKAIIVNKLAAIRNKLVGTPEKGA